MQSRLAQNTIVECAHAVSAPPWSAVYAWKQYFEGRFPGLTVVASSATAGDASALALIEVILNTSVQIGGKCVQVG